MPEKKKSRDLEVLAPLGLAAGARALNVPLSWGDRDPLLYRRLAEMAKGEGIEVRDYPKRSYLQRLRHAASGLPLSFDTSRSGHRISVPKGSKGFVLHTPEKNYPSEELAGKKIVWAPRAASPLAHEMGHMDRPSPSMMRMEAANLLAAGGLATGVIGAMRTKDPETAKRYGEAGAVISALAALPQLHREAAASLSGMRRLKALGATRMQRFKAGLPMAAGFLSHAAGSAVAPAASLAISRILARRKAKEK